MMSRIKVRSLTTDHTLLPEFGELFIELYVISANYVFSTMVCPSTPLLVSQSRNLTFLTSCRTRI